MSLLCLVTCPSYKWNAEALTYRSITVPISRLIWTVTPYYDSVLRGGDEGERPAEAWNCIHNHINFYWFHQNNTSLLRGLPLSSSWALYPEEAPSAAQQSPAVHLS